MRKRFYQTILSGVILALLSTAFLGCRNSGEKQAVSKEKNCDLYAIILDKYNSGIYSNRPNPIGRMLKDGQAKFENLSLDKQAYVLKQLVQLSLNSNKGADLRDLGGSSSTGTTKFSKNIESHNEFLLISMSPTGLYKSETNLLTV